MRIIHVVLVVVLLTGFAEAQSLGRGHRVLVNRGLQIQAWSFPLETGNFDVSRWAESNFTTIGLSAAPYRTPILPAAPGIPWSSMLYNGTPYVGADADIEPFEYPFLPSLVNLQVRDEQDITDPGNLANLTAAFANIRSLHPNVIMHTNQSGGQFSVAEMKNYMQQTQPDMLTFDYYPFEGTTIGGSPAGLYGFLDKYRKLGLGGNDGTGARPIPYGLYTQGIVWLGHTPSESEIRLNSFGAWAFGSKWSQSFIYQNHPDVPYPVAIMFSGVGTDNPTPQFYQVAETNRQSLNLGPALVRLLSTDVRMIMGQNKSSGFVEDNALYTGGTTWDAAADPYVTSITATNLSGNNNGLRGDVIAGYFNPLDASFTNSGYEDDIYFMIVNGLSDLTASTSETSQRIRLDFDFGTSGIDSLLRLSRDTGLVEEVGLVSLGGSSYYLDLVLEGGTGDLFKFNNGGLFVGTALSGDFNRDGNVTIADYNIMKANWLSTSNVLNVNGELTGPGGFVDGIVDTYDFREFKDRLFPGGASAFDSALASSVPEPSTVLLLLAAAPAWLLLRFRSGKEEMALRRKQE